MNIILLTGLLLVLLKVELPMLQVEIILLRWAHQILQAVQVASLVGITTLQVEIIVLLLVTAIPYLGIILLHLVQAIPRVVRIVLRQAVGVRRQMITPLQ